MWIALIDNKIKEIRLILLGHVLRRKDIEAVRLVKKMCVDGNKWRGRPKNR